MPNHKQDNTQQHTNYHKTNSVNFLDSTVNFFDTYYFLKTDIFLTFFSASVFTFSLTMEKLSLSE